MLHWQLFIGGGGCDIITRIVAHNPIQQFDYGLMKLHNPLIIEEVTSKIIETRLTLMFGGSPDILISIFTHKGGQYFDYMVTSLHCDLFIQNVKPKVIDTSLMLIFKR